MKPETAIFVEQARTYVRRGRIMLSASLNEDAGRAAYLVCFHAAQAVIFEKAERVVKTHNGVKTEFFRLIRQDDRDFDPALRNFLAESYEFKSEADYFHTVGYFMSAEGAAEALGTAERFIAQVLTILRPKTP